MKIYMRTKSGLIYHFEWGTRSGEVLISVRRGAKFAYEATKLLSAALIVVGIAGLFFTFRPIVTSELAYRFAQITGSSVQEIEVAEDLTVHAQDLEREQTRILARELGVPNTSFSVYVPKINAKAPIVQNVNPTNYREYMEALKGGVAHASGSVYPGMEGGTYLFAHSSDITFQTSYNTVFYLLRELEGPRNGEPGDQIYVFFLDKLYKYEVKEKHTVPANDTSWLVNAQTGSERLILQTCWPPGTALNRLVVIAEPVRE